MKIFSPPPQLLSAKSDGVQGGAWVGESNYFYRFFRVESIPNEFAFMIEARLNLEFEAGGSIEYICRISHMFTEYQSKPILMNYIILASKAAETLNKFFIAENYMDDTGVDAWKQQDSDSVAMQIGEKMREFYTTFNI